MYIQKILASNLKGTKVEKNQVNTKKDLGFDCDVSLVNLPEKRDLISFKSVLKKSHFKGIDLAVVEKYKAPIQNFRAVEQLQSWSKANFLSLGLQRFKAKSPRATQQRSLILKEWFNYLEKGNDAYSNALKLLIFSSIALALKQDDDTLPPALNPGVLAGTVTDLEKLLSEKPNAQFNFNEMYKNKMHDFLIQDDIPSSDMTGWVEIPSLRKSPSNFEGNVKKLQSLSHKNWCTKSFNARPYLEKGDFHIYLENGKPKLGVRFEGTKIVEVEGELNDQKIPAEYFEIFKFHKQKGGYNLSGQAKREAYILETKLPMIKKMKEDLGSALELNTPEDYEKIFSYLGIKYERTPEDLFIISEYKSPSKDISFKDIGCDEQKLFDKIVKIEGDVDFSYTNIEKIRTLSEIGGNVLFDNEVHFASLGSLRKIGGDLTLRECCVSSLGNLRYIGGNVNNKSEYIRSLCKVKEVGGDVDFSQFETSTIKNLKKIGGDAKFGESPVESLGSLEYVGGYIDLENSIVNDLGNLKTVGGDLYLIGVEDLAINNLKTVYGDIVLEDSKIKSLGTIEKVGGNLDLDLSEVYDLGALKLVRGDVYLENSKLAEYDFDGVKVDGHFVNGEEF